MLKRLLFILLLTMFGISVCVSTIPTALWWIFTENNVFDKYTNWCLRKMKDRFPQFM